MSAPALPLILPDWPAPPAVRACVTTRLGGVSAAPFDSFNPATHVGDDARAVAANRALLRAHLPAGRSYRTLGTDGFGCSDTRSALRRHFGIDAEGIAAAAKSCLPQR